MDTGDVLTTDEQQRVLGKLLSLTDNRRVTWEAVIGRDDMFQLRIGTHIYILSSRDSDGLQPYRLEIGIRGNKELKQLAVINTKANDGGDADPTVNFYLQSLFETVYRFLHRSELEIKGLLEELDAIEGGTEPPF